MKRFIRLLACFLLLASTSYTTLAADGNEVQKNMAVTIDEARDIALHSYPGTVTHEESKKTRGGHVYKYCFDIQDDAVEQNVVVDAKTGKIIRYRVKNYQGK